MGTPTIRIAAAIAVAIGLAPVARGETYNVAADWSNTANPNGVWSYLQGTTLLPSQPTTCCGLPDVPSFAPSHSPGTFLPIFVRSLDGSEIGVHSWDPFNGQAALGEAVLAWTAPDAAIIDVSGYFYYGQYTDFRSNDVIVRLRDTVLDSAVLSYFSHQNSANRWNFSFANLSVSTGDKLTFTFQRSAGYAAGSGDGGNVIVVTTPVPEPHVYILMLAGLSAIIIRKYAQQR